MKEKIAALIEDGRKAAHEGDTQKSEEIFNKALDLMELSFHPTSQTTILEPEKEQAQLNIVFCEAILETVPNLYGALIRLGDMHQILGNDQECLNVLNHAASTYPEYPDAFVHLSYTYSMQKNFQLADKYLDMAKSIDPNSVAVNMQLVERANQRHDYDTALPLAEKAFASEPDNENVQYLLASVLYEKKEYDRSQQIFKKLLTANPNDAAVLFGLALDEWRLGHYEDAIQLTKQSLTYDPYYGPTYRLLLHLQMRTWKWREMLGTYRLAFRNQDKMVLIPRR